MSLSVKLSSSGVMSMRPELSAWIGRGGGGWVKVNASSCGELGQEPSRVRVMYGRKKGAWSNIGKGELEHSQQRERSPGGRGEKHVHTPYLAKRDLQRGIKRELMTTRWEHAPPPPRPQSLLEGTLLAKVGPDNVLSRKRRPRQKRPRSKKSALR